MIAKRASRVGVGTVASASAAVVRGDCRGEVAAADAYAAATVVSTVTIAESDITFVAVFKEGLVYILKGCDVSKLALSEEQNSGRGFDNLQEDRRGVPGRPDNIVVQTHKVRQPLS